jgi:hypothetical protein
VLEYDPETGLFRWKVRRANGQKTGWFRGVSKPNGYLRIVVFRKAYYAHRLAWLINNGGWPEFDIDHEDGDRSNNKISNLRSVTRSVNMMNSSLSSRSTSGHTGVYLNKNGKWYSEITVNKKKIYLGQSGSKDEAVIARKTAEKKYGFHKNHGKKM